MEGTMEDVQQLIDTTRHSQELKRALAVRNTLAGRPWEEVARELGVRRTFISKWRSRYKKQGAMSLRMGYHGSQGYLSPTERQRVIAWIQAQDCWQVAAVQQEVETTYGVRYRSKQSYYALLKEARISWKKTQKVNPQGDPDQILAKRAEIQKKSRRPSRPSW
jgi:putative transposase